MTIWVRKKAGKGAGERVTPASAFTSTIIREQTFVLLLIIHRTRRSLGRFFFFFFKCSKAFKLILARGGRVFLLFSNLCIQSSCLLLSLAFFFFFGCLTCDIPPRRSPIFQKRPAFSSSSSSSSHESREWPGRGGGNQNLLPLSLASSSSNLSPKKNFFVILFHLFLREREK